MPHANNLSEPHLQREDGTNDFTGLVQGLTNSCKTHTTVINLLLHIKCLINNNHITKYKGGIPINVKRSKQNNTYNNRKIP